MTPKSCVILFILGVFALAIFSRWILDNPRGEPLIGFVYRFIQLYARGFHHLEVIGRENIPQSTHPGPLVVVCNHTAGVDPLLVQAACPFEVRWMMAADMRLPRHEWFWRWTGIISVDRTGKDAALGGGSGGTREAIRHLKEGGVLGVFPEGAIENPERHILPFHPGVGLIVARTGAPVLPVVIEGTPRGGRTWASLWRPSHSRITISPLLHMQADRQGGLGSPQASLRVGPSEIAQRLHDWYQESTGWPTAPTPRGPAFRG